MADITTFYPGGSTEHPVPLAATADESNRVDDQNVATPLYFWSGTQAAYDAIVTAYNADNTSHPNFTRTIYYTT